MQFDSPAGMKPIPAFSVWGEDIPCSTKYKIPK